MQRACHVAFGVAQIAPVDVGEGIAGSFRPLPPLAIFWRCAVASQVRSKQARGCGLEPFCRRALQRPSTYARRQAEKGEKTGGNGGKPSHTRLTFLASIGRENAAIEGKAHFPRSSRFGSRQLNAG